MEITQAVVDELLDNAVDNGETVDFAIQNPEELCVDLATYARSCEGAEIEQLLPLVSSWLRRRHGSELKMKRVEYESSTLGDKFEIIVSVFGYGTRINSSSRLRGLHDVLDSPRGSVRPTYGKDAVYFYLRCEPDDAAWRYLRAMEYVNDFMRLRVINATYAPPSFTAIIPKDVLQLGILNFMMDETDPLVQEMKDSLLVDEYRSSMNDLAKVAGSLKRKK